MTTQTVLRHGAPLRRRAEARAAETKFQDLTALSPDEVSRLLYELRVHQIELQMQNEELIRAQAELENSRARYFGLYHLAPVGYVALSERGLILGANLRAAALLRPPAGSLVRRLLSRFIFPADAEVYAFFHEKLFRTGEPQVCEVRLAPPGAGAPAPWVRLEATLMQDEEQKSTVGRVVLSDITALKRAEAEQKREAERLRGLLASIDSVVALVDYEGRCVYMNDVAASQLHGTAQELIGKTLFDLFPAEMAAEGLLRIRAAIREDRASADEVQTSVQGHPRWYRACIQPIHDETGRVIYALINATDIHDSKATEQELQALTHTLEERVRQRSAEAQDLYDHAPCGYHSLNGDGNLIMINETELDWLGYDRDEVIGKPLARFLTPASVRTFAENFPRLKATGAVADIELELIRKDGTLMSVLVSAMAVYDRDGRFLSSRATMFDISERKKADERLRFQSQLLEVVGRAAIATDLERRITYWNRAAEEMFGWTAAEAIGHTVWERTGAVTTQAEAAEMMAAERAGQLSTDELLRHRRDGSPFWAQVTDAPVRDANGQLIGIVGVLMDISARKQAEESLRLANLELERAVRLKDEFLANMSHELRTPLGAVLGYAEVLAAQHAGSLNDEQQHYVQAIAESGSHLLELINSILELARISAGKTEIKLAPVDVASVAQISLRMVRELAQRKSQRMGFEMDTAVSLVLADARRLKQILVNLLSNAIKFTPDGGQIGLEVHGDSENRILSFAVWDTGIGIRQEDLARLFRPFTQLDASTTRAAQGTGLGLALVSQMARLHGGGVTVESEPGQGSRFIVSIPWLAVPEADAPDSAEERTEAAPPPPQTAGPDLPPATGDRRPKVLLVDDTEAGRSLVRDYLGARGYRVLTAGDGFDGVAQAAEDRPDIILMDVMMPGLDGIETTRRMRNVAELEHTPIIALTALAMPGDRERCLAAGMNDYLSKPVKLAQLAQVIERQLAASADAAPAAV